MKWWGYKHINGSIHVKRFFSQEDITEASESPFVVCCTKVIDADSREDAITKVTEELL
jgi:hypothetical protein